MPWLGAVEGQTLSDCQVGGLHAACILKGRRPRTRMLASCPDPGLPCVGQNARPRGQERVLFAVKCHGRLGRTRDDPALRADVVSPVSGLPPFQYLYGSYMKHSNHHAVDLRLR
jgi:hypothetical protein